MKMEDDIRVVPVYIRALSVELASDALDNGILEPERCKVAVSDPSAVGDCLGDGKALFRIDPVLPGQGEGMLIELVCGLQLVISVNQNQKPCCTSTPHAELVGGLQVRIELNSTRADLNVLCTGLFGLSLDYVVLVCRS